MTFKDIMELSIPQLEYIIEGCRKNNEDAENAMNHKETLEGADAVQYLVDNGEI